MMKFVSVAVAVFSLLSMGQSAPVSSCESLTQQLEIQSRDQLLGKWIYIAESVDAPAHKLLTKMLLDSMWGNITAAEESDKIRSSLNQKMLGKCFTLKTNFTLSNNTLTMEQPYHATVVQLRTQCPDCLVLYSRNTLGNSVYKGLQILSRRSVLSDGELEEFKKQVECLNLPPPATLNPRKGLCPDPSVSHDTSIVDLAGGVSNDDMNKLNDLLKTEGGSQMLVKTVTSALDQLEQN